MIIWRTAISQIYPGLLPAAKTLSMTRLIASHLTALRLSRQHLTTLKKILIPDDRSS